MSITIGVDIGGSHITSAAVDIKNSKILSETYFRGSVNSKASKDHIFKDWSKVINKTINSLNTNEPISIGFAMPGPFQYKEGRAMFKKNNKYESLYDVSVIEELIEYIIDKNIELRFLNDASSFGVGGQLSSQFRENKRVVAITIGTGFGAAFLKDKCPIINDELVPEQGCLWNKYYKDSIADDYFSTRWFISSYSNLSGKTGIEGVKDIVTFDDIYSKQVFQEFSNNLAAFMFPYLLTFKADLLLIGGNIAKSHKLFLPLILEDWKRKGMEIPVQIIQKSEETNLIGAAYLFNENFWETIKDELPVI